MMFEESGSIETSSISEREIVLGMFSRHYNMHSLIPDQNGTYRSAKQIHLDCINELYAWCHSRNYFRLWAYLFVNWYAPEQWKLWARSSCATGIPVLKTTMIVESHCRMVKHDYLHQYNRPRVDLVVSILTFLVIPQAVDKMNAIRSKNHRKAVTAWRKTFKKNWDDLLDSVVDQDLLKYHTNPINWTCAYPGFLMSQFLVCKHIKFCYEKISDRPKLFSEIERQRESPFWVHEQLTLRPEHRLSTIEIPSDNDNESDSDNETESETEFFENDLANLEDEILSVNDGASHLELDSQIAVRTAILEILKQQKSNGNTKFVEVYFNGKTDFASDKIILEEIQRIERQRIMPATWSRYKHPATVFYK
ncbi:hypothetical protein K3495_g5378 [Podosphaera aphanis]|nr:hypothetical protein K3495_g5378 [Podosphaera aphanis]